MNGLNKGIRYCIGLGLLIVILFILNLLVGSVKIPISEIWKILIGVGGEKESWRFIILESRLPQALTATLCGAALSVSGLMLQTAFRNPLAGPDVFGINSGAGLAVALVMLAPVTLLHSTVSIFLAAFIGAMVVTVIIFFFSTVVRNDVMLLIIGIMIGFLASSAISLLNFFATEEGVKSYMIWGMGNFGGVSMAQMPGFASITIIGLLASILLIKPLNALLLGEQYAENLGINTIHLRNWLLVITGVLTAVSTAFCGPIVFLGLAVPHMARLLLTTENHRQLLPATIFTGSAVALLCNLICFLPGEMGMIPLNAVTPFIGAPVIIYVILKRK